MSPPKSLFDFIDACDDKGVYRFTEPARFLDITPGSTKVQALRSLIDSHFYQHVLFTLKLERVKKWVIDIEANAVVDDKGDWHVSLNLARFFLLPALNPAQELAELRGFLDAAKPFFEANPSLSCDVQFCNERARNRSVYASLSCRTVTKGGGRAEKDEAHSARLSQLVQQSETLTAFTKQVAMTLGKLGPHSWFCLTEEHLYGQSAGPHFSHLFADRMRVSRPTETAGI